ncbi:aldo/keto reductase [Streptomyces sp. NPDC004044]
MRRASPDAPDRVRLGDSTVRRMAFGAMRLAGPGIWGPPAARDHSIRLARRAVELGVDHIDTADAYGFGVVEDILREALHPYPDRLLIATKVGQVQPRPGAWVPVKRRESTAIRPHRDRHQAETVVGCASAPGASTGGRSCRLNCRTARPHSAARPGVTGCMRNSGPSLLSWAMPGLQRRRRRRS